MANNSRPSPIVTPTPPVRGETEGVEHKPNGPIIGLVFLVLLLTLAAVGIIISTQKAVPKPEIFANACKSQIDSAVLDGVREITRACIDDGDGTPAPATTKVPAQAGTVGFNYPYGWSANTYGLGAVPNVTNALWAANLAPGPIFNCRDCDGPLIDVQMLVGQKTDPAVVTQPDFKTYLEAAYSEPTVYSDVQIQSVTEGLGERFMVTGRVTGLYSGTFENIYFVSSTTWASVNFTDVDPTSTVTNNDWELIKNSLDFSAIK